jgi:hypothetical protein
VRHIQCDQSRPFGSLQRPKRIEIFLPVRQSRKEVRLRGPDHAVVHGLMIFQALDQHEITCNVRSSLHS